MGALAHRPSAGRGTRSRPPAGHPGHSCGPGHSPTEPGAGRTEIWGRPRAPGPWLRRPGHLHRDGGSIPTPPRGRPPRGRPPLANSGRLPGHQGRACRLTQGGGGGGRLHRLRGGRHLPHAGSGRHHHRSPSLPHGQGPGGADGPGAGPAASRPRHSAADGHRGDRSGGRSTGGWRAPRHRRGGGGRSGGDRSGRGARHRLAGGVGDQAGRRSGL